MKNLKQIFAGIFISLLATLSAFAAPLPALFYASTFDANVGDTITFDLKVNPNSATPVFTVGATLKYDPSILTFSDASVDKAWLPLSRPPYEVTDSGTITRTAGYPEGLKTTANFTHYTFKAKAEGETKVVISGGMALDSENNDAGLQNKVITIRVGAKPDNNDKKPDTVASTDVKKEIPSKKLPQVISLESTAPIASYAGEAYSFSVLYKLKNQQSTTGSTTISLVDKNGSEVYKSSQDFNISSDTNLTFNIPAEYLNAGEYTLGLSVSSPDQKNASTLKKDIGFISKQDKIVERNVPVEKTPLYAYVIFGILLIIIFLMALHARSKKFRKFLKNF